MEGFGQFFGIVLSYTAMLKIVSMYYEKELKSSKISNVYI